MIITRRDILKAIRTEKLKAGAFIETKKKWDVTNSVDVYYEDDTCKVCAVGAVLRQTGTSSETIEDRAYGITCQYGLTPRGDEGDEFEAIKYNLYMNALSIRFERLAAEHGCGKKTRQKLAWFVKRHFPKTIKVAV